MTGKKITYHDIPVEDFKAQLEKAVLPEHALKLTVAVAKTFVNGGLDFTSDALTNLLGRDPVDTKHIFTKYWRIAPKKSAENEKDDTFRLVTNHY